MQVFAACPDVDRATGRAFLGRASPSEFAAAMQACAHLPQELLGCPSAAAAAAAVRGDAAAVGGASAELLRSCLRAACSPDVLASASIVLCCIRRTSACLWRCCGSIIDRVVTEWLPGCCLVSVFFVVSSSDREVVWRLHW